MFLENLTLFFYIFYIGLNKRFEGIFNVENVENQQTEFITAVLHKPFEVVHSSNHQQFCNRK